MKEQTTTPTIKAVAYARFSSEHQRDESIDAQLRAIRDFSQKNGFTIVGEYIDRAYSAMSEQRPDFQRMIRDAGEGKFQAIIIHKLDRFSRERYDSAYYMRELKKCGVQLFSVTENIDNTPESVIMESVLVGMAEYYSKNLARETMKGLNENAYNGKHTGGLPPLGYKVDPVTKRIGVNEQEAGAVKLIFDMAAGGAHYPDIFDELNRKGYRTKTGKEFGSSSLHDILKNQKYIGVCVYNKRVSQDICNSSRKFKDESEWIVRNDVYPPLVSEEVFNLVQERLKKREVSGQAHPKEVYLLSGKIRCGVCGTAYCGERKRNGKGIISYSYFCNSRNKGHGSSCGNPSINRTLIESYVLQRLAEYVFSDSLIPDIVSSYNRYLQNRNSSSVQRLNELTKQSASIQRQINSVIDLLIDTQSSTLKDKLKVLESRKDAIQEEIAHLSTSDRENMVTEEQLRDNFSYIRSCLSDGTLTGVKKLIDVFIHEVVVYPQKVVVIFNLYPQIKFMHKTGKEANKTDKEGPDEGLSSFYPEIMSDELCRTECSVHSFEEGRQILERIRGLSGIPPDM